MNVLISTDLEGISGVSAISHIFDRNDEGYLRARQRLMVDTNAAVRAAAEMGAEKIYTVDGHAGGGNFIPGMLDARATEIKVKDLAWVKDALDAVLIIGAHAKAGTLHAFLDHTQSSSTIHRYFYNGKEIGELSQLGTFFGHFGIPCVMVSGDSAACKEAKDIFGSGIAVARVKHANERNVAECVDEDEAERMIYEATKQGLAARKSIPPMQTALPLEICIEFHMTSYCDEACRSSLVERVDGYTARAVKTKIESFFDVLL